MTDKPDVYFPGFTKKSLTFTIDDGNVKYDRIFLDIVKPFGILGTFNLCSHLLSSLTPDEYRKFYRGYEISNHMKYHPTAIPDSDVVTVSCDEFDPMNSQESKEGELIMYKTCVPGLYKFRRGTKTPRPGGWGSKADNEGYKRFISEGKKELEAIFGAGSIRGFVWPCEEQSHNKEILDHVRSLSEYYGVRKTGEVLDTSGFDMPEDRRAWSYNATCRSLLSLMEKYERYPDDGKLKFFSFGVHSGDFETYGKWDDLRIFAEKYGNRQESYYYATVGDIFDYEDAASRLQIDETEIKNPTDVSLYIKIKGKKVILPKKSCVKLSEV